MLGIGPISSRGISGSPFKLVAVPLTLAASGTLLSLGGTASGNNYLNLSAYGSIVSLSGLGTPLVGIFSEMSTQGTLIAISGSAVPTWTQEVAASGNIIRFSGTPRLFVAGKPFIVQMIAERFSVTQANQHYRVKMIHARYSVRGYP